MKTRAGMILPVMIAVAVWCGSADAGRVTLKDGTRLLGRVWLDGDWVAVEYERGISRVPMRRVAGLDVDPVGPARADVAPSASRAEAGVPARPRPIKQVQPSERPPRPPARTADSGRPNTLAVLESRMDVDIDGVPIYDLLNYIQATTNVNMAVGAEVRNDQRPVTLHLKNVPVNIILKVALNPLDFGYEVRYGNILCVRDKKTVDRANLRVYDVRDLLVDWGDSGRGDDDDDDDDDDNNNQSNADRGEGRRYSRRAHAEELVNLIKLVSGPGKWAVQPYAIYGEDEDRGRW